MVEAPTPPPVSPSRRPPHACPARQSLEPHRPHPLAGHRRSERPGERRACLRKSSAGSATALSTRCGLRGGVAPVVSLPPPPLYVYTCVYPSRPSRSDYPPRPCHPCLLGRCHITPLLLVLSKQSTCETPSESTSDLTQILAHDQSYEHARRPVRSCESLGLDRPRPSTT